MIIDVHTHIFPSAIRQNRQKFFPSESAFKLLYQSPKARLIGGQELISVMDASRVDQAVVFGFPWTNIELAKTHNDYILEMVQQYPDRFIGLGCFDPASPGAAAEAERCLAGGLCGIGELAFYQSGIDDSTLEQLEPIMGMCAERSLPVLIHTNEPVGHDYHGKTPITLSQIYGLIKRFADNKIVLAHWGGGLFFYTLMKKEVKKSLKNVYFDTAASPYLYDPEVYQIAIKFAGIDKILFGSDYPLLSPEKYFSEMQQSGLAKDQIEQICGLNATRLFNSGGFYE
ncbi:amidohydrolase family protein [Thermodesulfobacteriota bacterium]